MILRDRDRTVDPCCDNVTTKWLVWFSATFGQVSFLSFVSTISTIMAEAHQRDVRDDQDRQQGQLNKLSWFYQISGCVNKFFQSKVRKKY